jgi:hypothetical protein
MSPRPLTQIKHFTDGLVVRWVTTSESPLLYVFDLLDVEIRAVIWEVDIYRITYV